MRKTAITKVMSTDVITVQRTQTISEVWDVMRNTGVHHVPVLDGAQVVGMLSATDVLKLAYDIDSSDDRMLRSMMDHQFTIDDAMSETLTTLPVSATVKDAADVLSDNSLHSVVIIDGRGDIAGIVTSTDLIRFLRDL